MNPPLHHLRLLALLVIALLAPRLSATTTYTVNNPAVANYLPGGPAYVIDADRSSDVPEFSNPFFNRWYVTAQATVSAVTTTAFSISMQTRFRLVDATGVVVPCENADINGYVPGLFSTFSSLGAGTVNSTRSVNLVPTVTLDPALFYRVEAIAYSAGRGAALDSAQSSQDFRFVHFTGPNGSDASTNAVGLLGTGANYTKTYAVQTEALNSSFSLNIPYTLYRYDEPASSIAAGSVGVQFTVELFDAAAPAVPVATSGLPAVVSIPIDTRGGFFIPVPVVFSGTASLSFKPAAGIQLNSPGKTYFARVSLAHIEKPGTLSPPTFAVLKQDNQRDLAAARLLHFNGALIFGQSTANPIHTIFTSISNNPSTGAVVTPLSVDTALGITSAGVDGTQHTYTGGVLVSLLANGDSLIRGVSIVTLTPPTTPDRDTSAGVRFERQPVVLSTTGAFTSNVSVILPPGMGWAAAQTDKTLNGRFDFPSLTLNQQLDPAQPVQTWLPAGGTGWVMEESKPMLIGASSVSWTVGTGRFDITAAAGSSSYVRGTDLAALEASPVPAVSKIKRSNEQYWRWAQIAASASRYVQAGLQGGAEFTGGYTFSNPTLQTFRTHFPHDATMVVGSGQASIAADLLQPATSTLTLAAGNPSITMTWLNGCSSPYCLPGLLPTTLQSFTPSLATLRFTQDGGLVAAGSFPSGLDLKWGFTPMPAPQSSVYAHRVATPFGTGTFAMSGIFLKGSANPAGSVENGPGVILLTGVTTAGAPTERPATNAYTLGRTEYAGFNASLGVNDATPSGINGQSYLAGRPYGPYSLKKRCKYYVRPSGVAGIHDKVAGPAETMNMYGYDFTLTNFGLSFIDNSMRDSRVNGRVIVAGPSQIFVDFEELRFFCNGGLDKAKIATSTPPETLEYWNAPIDIQAMQFLHPDGCDPTKGFLTLGLLSYSSHFTDTLAGTVGFHAHGNLINKAFSDTQGEELAGLDSRFKMPKQVKFEGPKRQTDQGGFEEYLFTPSVDAYLNDTGLPTNSITTNWKHTAPPGAAGFWNFGGRLKVAFFESPQIHLQTTPNRPPLDFVAPGPWRNSVIKVANGKWDTGAATTSYFDSSSYHDTWNRGLPYPVSAGGTGDSLLVYNSDPKYLPVTRQAWLGGAIEFKYKLLWNSSTRSFTTLEASESQESGAAAELAQQLVILKINHRLPYLSAERAELTFGASYSGMPKINLANFVVNELDDATGVFKAATDAGCGVVFKKVDEGLGSLARMLNDQLHDYFTAALDPLVDGVTDSLYGQVLNLWNATDPANPNATWNAANLDAIIAPALVTFRAQLQVALTDVNASTGQFKQISALLAKTNDALAFLDTEFFKVQNGQITLVRGLAKQLIIVLSKEIGGTLGSIVGGAGLDQTIGGIIDPLLKDAQPTLFDLKGILLQLKAIIVEAQNAASGVGEMVKEIEKVVNDQIAELGTLTDAVTGETKQFLSTFHKQVGGKNFLAFSKDEVRLKIEQAIYDRFFGTQLLAKVQTVLKQHLQDVEAAIRSGIDSVFAEVNKLVKKTISGLLAEVDDKINGVLGEFGKYLGSAAIVGYATFNGDALRKLRMDGKFEFKVPTAVHIEAFLEINQYTSKDKPPGCAPPPALNETLTEVTVGATNVPTDFLSPGVKLNLDAKFSFETKADGTIWPVGMGGAISMAEGPISLEALKITKLAVGVAFGRDDNYFSAALGVLMKGYGGNGGVFFGRTCTLDPIKLWDPFAAKALGQPNPSFTGIYVYGEVHIPVLEVVLGIPATCFLDVSADVGAGFFVFAEGPTFGARMALGVTGQVACIISISGRLDLLGGKFGGVMKLTGKGEFCASIIGIEACKSILIHAEVSTSGDMDGDYELE